ncbi:hypothetical protein [Streptomyces sp. col6]|uniref:hypothetical protein n=1 Tax=Streptomyces sp. col6 TaxID=2478958 RepID=UPI0017467552|nr:hypothetical protein [Streptomyces sp. col6]
MANWMAASIAWRAELSGDMTVASGGARARIASVVVPVTPHSSTILRLSARPACAARSRLEALYIGWARVKTAGASAVASLSQPVTASHSNGFTSFSWSGIAHGRRVRDWIRSGRDGRLLAPGPDMMGSVEGRPGAATPLELEEAVGCRDHHQAVPELSGGFP